MKKEKSRISKKPKRTKLEEDQRYTAKKDRRKIIFTTFETIFLLILAFYVVKNLFVFSTYEAFNEMSTEMADNLDNGFIAISYFGIARDRTDTLVSTDALDEQLKALHKSGYVTISQQDIIDYYKEGKPLPDKSLFLMFEDGRRDTAIFAEKIMEKYNNLGTILTYAEKFAEKDSAFLQPKDILALLDSSYWELGTNGYRLAYINVFDRYDRYLGQLDTNEFREMHDYLRRDYNHYLMDYIRDEYNIPMESYEEMRYRINYDYELMKHIYTENLNLFPKLYVLMHANTGRFGENEKVSKVNKVNILSNFRMNFNREGYSLNNRDNSIYDLTRVQPQAHWHTNHLLMRIYDDTGKDLEWVEGDLKRKSKWTEIDGVSEFDGNSIYVTCDPKKEGTLRLNGSKDFSDLIFSVELEGNAFGKQAVYLRADQELLDYIKVSTENGLLCISDENQVLYEIPIDELIQSEYDSIEEDSKAALVQEKETRLKYADSLQKKKILKEELDKINQIETKSVEEGAEAYIPDVSLNQTSRHQLLIKMKGNKLTVALDGFNAVEDMEVDANPSGYIGIQSGWGGNGDSQISQVDTVYDGVFKDIKITENTGADKEKVLYDNMIHGREKAIYVLNEWWNKLINLFIDVF